MVAGVDLPEFGGGAAAAVAFELPAPCSSQPGKLPRRVRERLMETKSLPSVEEIEAKLRDAGLRRQVRPPTRSSLGSYQVLVPAPSPRFSGGKFLLLRRRDHQLIPTFLPIFALRQIRLLFSLRLVMRILEKSSLQNHENIWGGGGADFHCV